MTPNQYVKRLRVEQLGLSQERAGEEWLPAGEPAAPWAALRHGWPSPGRGGCLLKLMLKLRPASRRMARPDFACRPAGQCTRRRGLLPEGLLGTTPMTGVHRGDRARRKKVAPQAIGNELERQGVADALADHGFNVMDLARVVIRAADGDVGAVSKAVDPDGALPGYS